MRIIDTLPLRVTLHGVVLKQPWVSIHGCGISTGDGDYARGAVVKT